MWFLIAGLLGIGAILKGIATQHQTEAATAEAQRKAAALEELSKTGGYYEQTLAALQTELDDIEADRTAAAQLLAITETELKGEIAQSFVQEKAQIAGLEAQKAGQEAQKAGQIVAGIETAQAGAEAVGQVKAVAGAGGLAQAGSVLRRSEAIATAVGRRMAAQNLAIGAAGQAIQATGQAMIATRGAAALQRGRLQNDITRSQLSYENELRNLITREATAKAKETLTEFQKEQGLTEAAALRGEEEWLKTWGVGLGWASALTGGLTDILSLGQIPDFGSPPATTGGTKTSPYREDPWVAFQ